MNVNIVNKAEDYIEANLDKKITLHEVAASVHFSDYHFHRMFSASSNETIHQFISRIKIERSAIFMVVNSSFSITEIAYKYGFSNSSSYSKAFKRHYHMSPSDFRKKARNDKQQRASLL